APAVAPLALERPPAAPALPALTTAALAARPELADLALQQEALARRITVTRAEARPQVELNGFLGRQVREFENFSDSLYDDYAVSLGLRWEFFDGGRRAGQIAQFESQRRQLALQQEDLAAEIRLDLEEALTSYRTALARWESAEVAAAAAREASRVAKDSYQEGVALQTDWLDAQRQETETEILAVDAYYDARREAARLARAVGTLPSAQWPSAALLAAAARAQRALEEER
ncbi:MAG TPA: TolC family protein, partial [Thermoanaerobaculia bacterium]|nr:TolC family protein [Thermoanaerobaculia bacterium]